MALHLAADGAGELMRRTRDACARLPARGRLPPPVIQKVVRSKFEVFRKCYEDGLRRDPKLEGHVVVRFVIERDGAVRTVEEAKPAPPDPLDWREPPDAHERMPDPRVSACVVEGFRQLTFPPPEAGIVTVTYPIMFSPGAP